MYLQRIISKVPGNIPTEPKKEKQGYVGDLSEKTVPQLNELLDRQIKLLANKSFISNLADKGEKITKLKESIEEELKKRNDSENLSRMLSAMSMNGKEDLDALEWTGRCAPGHVATEDNISDDETDPFKILATHSGAGFHKKKHRIVKPAESLIKPSDLVDLDMNKSKDCKEDNKHKELEDEVLDEYAKQLCEKMDSVKSINQKSKFMPHKTLKGSTTEKKDGVGKKGRGKWEVTAATPPPPVHGDAKMVSLQESIKLQYEQQQKFKEVQMKHAAERLAAAATGYSLAISRAPQHVGDYRDPTSGTSSEDEGSEHEVHDEEEPDGGGVVIYNLVDDPENS